MHCHDCRQQTDLQTRCSGEGIGSRSWVTFTSPLYLYRTAIGPALIIIRRSTCAWSSPRSPNRPLNKSLLQPCNLVLECLDLLPAVQRSAVMGPQACDNSVLCLVQVGVDLLQLLPLLELGAQLLNLLCDARPAHVLLSLLFGEGGG